MGLRGWSLALGLCAGYPATYLGAHPPKVSAVGAHLGFPVWAARLLIEVCAHPGALCLCTQASGLLIWHTDPRLWVGVGGS